MLSIQTSCAVGVETAWLWFWVFGAIHMYVYLLAFSYSPVHTKISQVHDPLPSHAYLLLSDVAFFQTDDDDDLQPFRMEGSTSGHSGSSTPAVP